MTTGSRNSAGLSTVQAATLYIGALLGPSVLLLPGLAAALAGPASILAWAVLLVLSAALARVFTALGTRFPTGGGVAAYVAAGLGSKAGRVAAGCFLAGVIFGAPVVCLIGGGYVAELLGGGRPVALAAAGVLLVAVIGLTVAGARASGVAQLGLVGLLVALVAVAVIGSAPAARSANWTPFLPHGPASLGRAGSVLMLSFVGWEAIAPLTSRLRDPARQLPRVILIALAATSGLYLALAAATIGVLGAGAGTAVPLSRLLGVAIGTAGPAVAAVLAVALTLAATNAYLSGAAAMATALRGDAGSRPAGSRPVGSRLVGSRLAGFGSAGRGLQLAVGIVGLLVLAANAAGLVSTAQLVAIPTALFLTVYVGCTVAAARLFGGALRLVAIIAAAVVTALLLFTGWALLAPAAVALLAARRPRGHRPTGAGEHRPTGAPAHCPPAPRAASSTRFTTARAGC